MARIARLDYRWNSDPLPEYKFHYVKRDLEREAPLTKAEARILVAAGEALAKRGRSKFFPEAGVQPEYTRARLHTLVRGFAAAHDPKHPAAKAEPGVRWVIPASKANPVSLFMHSLGTLEADRISIERGYFNNFGHPMTEFLKASGLEYPMFIFSGRAYRNLTDDSTRWTRYKPACWLIFVGSKAADLQQQEAKRDTGRKPKREPASPQLRELVRQQIDVRLAELGLLKD